MATHLVLVFANTPNINVGNTYAEDSSDIAIPES